MHDSIEVVFPIGRNQSVDVVRHHTPGDQRIAIAVEGQNRGLNQFRNRRNRQIAPAMASIESGVDKRNALVTIGPVEFFTQFGGKAIGQSEDEMLNEVRAIDMRKITARTPPRLPAARAYSRCRLEAGAPRIAGRIGAAGILPACRLEAGGPK